MKAIPIPLLLSSLIIGLINWARSNDFVSSYRPDAGYVFFLFNPIWNNNMDDKYEYQFVRSHIYKRFTVKYWDEIEPRGEFSGAKYGVFETYDNRIRHYKENRPKFYWGEA